MFLLVAGLTTMHPSQFVIAQKEGLPAGGTVHAFDLRTRNNFMTFPVDDPTSIEFLDKNRNILAMDFDNNDNLHAIDANSMTCGRIIVPTGEFVPNVSVAGSFGGDPPTGMTFNVSLNTFMVTTRTELYVLNVVTGATILVGTYTAAGPDPTNMMEIAADQSGQLYGFEADPVAGDGQISGGLWAINPNTAQCTLVAPNFIEAVGPQGMDFDSFTGNLYVMIHAGLSSRYGIWNQNTGNFSLIVPLSAFGPAQFKLAIDNNTAHAYNHSPIPNQFITFVPNAPLPHLTVADIAFYDTHAIDFGADNTTLYIHDNLTDQWGTVDTDTGCFTPTAARTGDLTVDPNGLSYDRVSDSFYAVASGPLGSELYAVVPDTGDSFFLASISDDGDPLDFIVDIAISRDGDFFVFDVATDLLYQLNPGTGEATPVGDPGVSANFAQGMDFDPCTGVLYQSVYTGNGLGSYGFWDISAGTFTEIMPLPAFFDPIGNSYELEIAISCSVILGDVNGDGEVNLLDVAPFVDLLTSGGYNPAADINMDGEVNLLDVQPFVQLLGG